MTEAHTERAHARLAPSAAHRWASCPGSVVLEAALPDPPGPNLAADEGTCAHVLADHCLKHGWHVSKYAGRCINIHGKDTATIFLAKDAPADPQNGIWPVTDEMVECVEEYVALVRKTAGGAKGELLIEQRVHATRIHEDCQGTADAIIYRPDEKTLHVMDLKYGRGVVVEAEGNKQLAIYASGARMRFHNREIGAVAVHIFQPRAPHRDGKHRMATFYPDDLDAVEAELKLRAELVGDAAAADDVSGYLEAGDHCRFCKAAATCPARANLAVEIAQTEFGDTTELQAPEAMSSEELAKVLHKARQIQHWIKAVEEHAHKEALAGRMPDGFKLVAGRATRAWVDEGRLKLALPVLTSVDEAGLYEPPKLLSPAKLEKLLPKDERASLEPFITKKSAGTLLVPSDDPRPAVTPDATAEFDAVEL